MHDLSYKKISEVSVGEKVLTPFGNIEEVKEVHCDLLLDDMYRFDVGNFAKSPYFTKDHPILSIKKDEIDKTKIYSRLDSDEAGGTVVNRFVVQAVLGIPLTVYGQGEHQRGFISLNDSIQALEIAINNPAKSGKVQVWNQLSEWHSMNDIAQMVVDVVGDVKVEHIDTPRNEHTGEHYYKYTVDILKKLGYKPTRTIKEEIEYVYNILKPYEEAGHLEKLKNVVIPKIKWN